jgi:hypothetical protein
MVPFHLLFPEVAQLETRAVILFHTNPFGLPPDTYGLVDLYCEQPGCDCRRVMLNVLSDKARRQVATINHGFEPSPLEPEQTFLDPLNPQSNLSLRLLKLVRDHVLRDEDYVARLHRHYRMFKDAVNDPRHPAQKVLRGLPPLPPLPLPLGPRRPRRR